MPEIRAISKLEPDGKILLTACFGNKVLLEHSCAQFFILSKAATTIAERNSHDRAVGLLKTNVFTIWPLIVGVR